MQSTIDTIQRDFPSLTFVEGKSHCWSPEGREVYYDISGNDESIWALLHELGHAHLGHTSYSSDIDLLNKEVQAWEHASKLGQRYGAEPNREYIEDCLDTYRDWLHKRSTCPSCGTTGLQTEGSLYICLNCKNPWTVSASRFCRPYRRSKKREPKTIKSLAL